jgi:hypothetical protein
LNRSMKFVCTYELLYQMNTNFMHHLKLQKKVSRILKKTFYLLGFMKTERKVMKN